ncbi:MAG: efflux RND transporter permease subunit [Chloroflexota bacterium]
MKLTEFSVRNPLFVFAVTAAITTFGLFAYLTLGVAITPNVNFPQVIVTTVYPGADPQTVETTVTKPIEDAIAGLQNIDTNGLTSVSTQGVSTVVVQFTSAVNPDLVSVDVERVVNAVRSRLPTDTDPPTVTKVDINAFGVATIIFSGDQPLSVLQDVAENLLQKQFNSVPGVGSTSIRSGITREIQVRVDEMALRARGLTINNVVATLQAQQLEMPAGSFPVGDKEFSVYFDSLVTRPEELGKLIVLQTPNGTVYLRDVASIVDTNRKRAAIVRVNGKEGLALVVAKLPDGDTISIVDGVRKTIDRLKPQLPPGTSLDIVIDSSTYTARSFNTVQRALLEAIACTGIILLLFLHTWRSTFIVLLSIPTSLLSTLLMMSILNYNLNLLTMMALTLSVGILVDDSIVVLENIYRHLDMGKAPRIAAVDGRNEIGLAALTITFVDVVVYLPIAVMVSGVSAQFLRPFALTIAFATLASLIVSFTLAPLLASRLLTSHHKQGNGFLDRFGRMWDRGFIWLERRYESLLRRSLPHRWLVVFVGMLSFGFGIALWAMGLIGSDFFPSGDQSEINITLNMPPSTTLDVTNQATQVIERILREHHEVRSTFTIVGTTSSGGPIGSGSSTNQSQITALLVSSHDRTATPQEIGALVRAQAIDELPTAKIQLGYPNAFGFGGFGGQPIQILVQGVDADVVDRLAAQAEASVRGLPELAGVRNSNENVQTQLRAVIDWSRASDLGVSAQSAAVALRAAIDGWRSNTVQFKQPGKTQVDIRVVSANATSADQRMIERMPVQGAAGIVQLDQFTTIRQVQIPTTIRHVNRLRSVTISADPADGKLVGDAQAAAVNAMKQIELPPGYAITYSGQGQQGGTAIRDIMRAIGIAVLLMYMLMMILFNSMMLPLSVLMSLPLAVVGAFGAMAMTGTPFTLFSLLGFAVLVGLVGKNAILLVDYTEILMERGYTRTQALLTAGPTRLRPIVMTTISVIVALLPIAAGVEEGSELLKSAAVVLNGGLITSTLLTLVFVPAMFTIFDDLQHAIGRLFRRGHAAAPGAPEGDGRVAIPPSGGSLAERELVGSNR